MRQYCIYMYVPIQDMQNIKTAFPTFTLEIWKKLHIANPHACTDTFTQRPNNI